MTVIYRTTRLQFLIICHCHRTEQDHATASALQTAKLNKNNSNILMESRSFELFRCKIFSRTLKLCLFSSQLSMPLWHFCICKIFRIGLVQLHPTSEFLFNLNNILKQFELLFLRALLQQRLQGFDCHINHVWRILTIIAWSQLDVAWESLESFPKSAFN